MESADASCIDCGSALFAAGSHAPDGFARRALDRVQRNMPLAFRSSRAAGTTREALTEDVSLSGMRFFSPVELAPGEVLSIECDFCSAVAEVRNVRHDRGLLRSRWLCGVEFLTLRVKRKKGGLFSTRA